MTFTERRSFPAESSKLPINYAGRRAPASKVLVSRSDREGDLRSDPHPLLESMDKLCRHGDGRFGFGPRLSLTVTCARWRIEWRPRPINFHPDRADVLDRCRYLRSFPSALTTVSHLRGLGNDPGFRSHCKVE